MNIKRIVKYLELKSQLTTEELQMAETMVGLTESDKEALAGLLQPVKAKVKPATTRVIEKCGACNYTRRAAHHKEGHKDYHEFQSSKKSARASSIAERVATSAKTITASGNHKPALCSFSIDGKVCHGEENDGIHDKSLGYGNYHPFVSSSPARNAVGQLSTNDDEVNSETGSGAVSSAAGD